MTKPKQAKQLKMVRGTTYRWTGNPDWEVIPNDPPDLPETADLADRLELRITQAEREAYERAAADDVRTLSNWVRLILNKAVKPSR